MFHDKALHDTRFISMAFDLNAQAFRLAALVEWYKARGERTLPVQYLKRIAFTRRQWELATKGSRKYDGRKLVDSAPAKDGCEALGLVSEYVDICPETKTPRTYWVIGEIDASVIETIRRERLEAAYGVIEDDRPPVDPEEVERAETAAPAGSVTTLEAEYDRGYAEGERAGYDRRDREIAVSTGCVKDACIETDYRGASLTHPVTLLEMSPCDVLKRRIQAEILWEFEARRESEKDLGF